MPFMEPQIEFGEWVEVETNCGIEFIPNDVTGLQMAEGFALTIDRPENEDAFDAAVEVIRDYVQGEPQSIRIISGYGARFSAPGYLDCTEWTVFLTEQEARDYLAEQSEDDPDDDDESIDD